MPSDLPNSGTHLVARCCDGPVFIIGVFNRSGTNYLGDILQLISSFEMPKLKEGYVLEHSAKLLDYVVKSKHRWQSWGDNADAAMLQSLGQGIEQFLRQACVREDSRLLMKTPRATGAENLFRLIPDAKLILLKRDGRDVVESAAKSFTWAGYGHWMREWRNAASVFQRAVERIEESDSQSRAIVVAYEELMDSPETSIERILSFLDVPVERFDWEQFNELPVRGSSQIRDDAGELTWEPLKKADDFAPIGRWRSWPWRRRMQFRIIAGRELRNLGYDKW